MTSRGSRQEFQEKPILWALIGDLLARSVKNIRNLFLLCSHPVEDSLELSMLLHSLGETSGTRHHMHPWELLKSGNKEQGESLKWKALLWGRVAYRQLGTRTLPSSCRFRLKWRLGCQEWICSNLQRGWLTNAWPGSRMSDSRIRVGRLCVI